MARPDTAQAPAVEASDPAVLVQLVQVDKQFGRRVALAGLSLTVHQGDIYGLLGHNGAGKSTAIGLMLGQLWPTRGQVRVCGYDVFRQRQRALARVGALFETPAFYEFLSGWRNLQILASYTAPTPARRIAEVIEWVGLQECAHLKVRAYSHGMRTRLALAQALLPGPDLLILDEPGSGLDPEGQHELRQTIRRLHHELGLTILLSSHQLHEVEQLCTRIGVLRQGRKVFEGTWAQVKAHSAWVRLRTNDFALAVARLKHAGLVVETRDDHRLALAPGVTTDRVVRHLVLNGQPVYEIAPVQMSLEDFYLGLMKPAVQTPTDTAAPDGSGAVSSGGRTPSPIRTAARRSLSGSKGTD